MDELGKKDEVGSACGNGNTSLCTDSCISRIWRSDREDRILDRESSDTLDFG